MVYLLILIKIDIQVLFLIVKIHSSFNFFSIHKFKYKFYFGVTETFFGRNTGEIIKHIHTNFAQVPFICTFFKVTLSFT